MVQTTGRRRLGQGALALLAGCKKAPRGDQPAATRRVGGPAEAVRAETLRAGEDEVDVLVVDPSRVSISVHLRDRGGLLLGSLDALERSLSGDGLEVIAAMNGGMFAPDHEPVGLLIEGGQRRHELALGAGEGNFYLLPNGVFALDEQGPRVVETEAFARAPGAARHATQSGPLLVRAGQLHPVFRPASTHRAVRNGVGVTADGQVAFAIARTPVTFFAFASLFRDRLGCPDALYLDGTISRMYLPALGRTALGGNFGPMIAVTRPRGLSSRV